MNRNGSLHKQLESLRPVLVRIADIQLGNRQLAEDAVHDALVAVLEQPERFAGRSSLRTYVVGILKFKIIDVLRRAYRERQFYDDEHQLNADSADSSAISWQQEGHTLLELQSACDPLQILLQEDFFRVLGDGLAHMSSKAGRAFLMREWLGLETPEICAELAITTSNAFVMAHRARTHLRAYLAEHWPMPNQ